MGFDGEGWSLALHLRNGKGVRYGSEPELSRRDPNHERVTWRALPHAAFTVVFAALNAAVALYGKSQRVQSFYPQCSIRLARFRGEDRLGDFIDNRQYWGHAFALLRRAETFLRDHVPIAGRVVSGRMKREDRPLYPPPVVGLEHAASPRPARWCTCVITFCLMRGVFLIPCWFGTH